MPPEVQWLTSGGIFLLYYTVSIILIDKVDDDFYHRVLLFCVAFSYHESEGYKSISVMLFSH